MRFLLCRLTCGTAGRAPSRSGFSRRLTPPSRCGRSSAFAKEARRSLQPWASSSAWESPGRVPPPGCEPSKRRRRPDAAAGFRVVRSRGAGPSCARYPARVRGTPGLRGALRLGKHLCLFRRAQSVRGPGTANGCDAGPQRHSAAKHPAEEGDTTAAESARAKVRRSLLGVGLAGLFPPEGLLRSPLS